MGMSRLPDVPARIDEARRPRSPRSIHRAVQELQAAGDQLRAHGVHVIDFKGELEARPRLAGCHDGRPDQFRGLLDPQQVHERLAESEDSRVVVLEEDRQPKHLPVELLRPLQVLDEEGDGGNAFRP